MEEHRPTNRRSLRCKYRVINMVLTVSKVIEKYVAE